MNRSGSNRSNTDEDFISIIIVNYNCGEYIINCIRSIYANITVHEYEIVVVDNASNDNSVRVIEETFPDVTMILNSENLGFAAANIIAVKAALGNFLFFLNPDTILLNDCVSIFSKFLNQSGKTTASCGGSLLDINLNPTYTFGNFPTVIQQFSEIGFKIFYKDFYRQHLTGSQACNFCDAREVPYIVGAALFIHKTIYEEVGGFDDRFFMYYEETDLFFRLRKLGYKSYIIPEARIIHFESITTFNSEIFNYFNYSLRERSKYQFFRKHRSHMVYLLAKFLQMLVLLVQYFRKGCSFNLIRALSITINA